MTATRLATVFDGYDEQGRPLLGPERRPLTDPDERRRVLAYLDGGVILLAGGPLVPDQLDPQHPLVVPVGYATDGVWIWGASLRYYVARYGIRPEPDLLRHIREGGYRVRVPTQQEIDQASADLQEYFRESAPP
ncbi:MAG: hypothetical protein ACXV1K_06290 [Kineosporiaceae bacterium]